jgi:hypothetical protein
MDLKALRASLKASGASWSVPENLGDHLDTQALSQEHQTGALPVPAGVLTARMPRMRRGEQEPVRAWQPGVMFSSRPVAAALPAAWSWRNVNGHDWVTPIRDQGGCGSCIAFASAAAVEVHWRLQKGQANLNVDLSEAALFFTNNRQCVPGDPRYGWWVPGALDFMVDEGDCYEPNYPYRPVNQVALLVEGTERTIKLRGYDSSSSTAQMKRWLFEEGPLITTYTVYDDFFAYWNGGASGVYSHVTGNVAGGHAVLVVGYDDGQSCWLCKNSWAPRGGGDGFFRVAYGQCGIDGRMYLVQDLYEVFTVDELPYNPAALRIVDEGANGWLLTDGVSRMKMFDTKEDARNALRVARRYTRHGFVGRDNPRGAKRMDYITEYWAGNSGLPWEPLTTTDAIPYNPLNVVAEDLDAQGWRLREGNHWMLLANDLNDALAILRVVERYSRMCFIGRNNHRPNRKSYIMTYWE